MRRTLRTLPTLRRIGVASAFAYRAEMLVWVLTTCMPLVMLPLWHAVSEQAPIQGFGPERFTAYFLAAFVVRQLTGAWTAWTINCEVRTGALSQRLLRPVSPILVYATEALASIPMRTIVAVPVAILALLATGGEHVARGGLLWAIVPFALLGAWAISFFAQVLIGALSLWMHQSIKLVDLWTAGFFVLSGYLVPVALFPASLRELPHWLPFEHQLGFPVELIIGALSPAQALASLATQWTWVALLGIAAALTWRRGIVHYGAFGG